MSLETWGQVKPIVVRRDKMIVVAGNGTLSCAKELGWSEIAVSIVDMNDAEAAAYGIADNRTAELAKWDEGVLVRLTKLIDTANQAMPGWTADELEVMRASDGMWVPPTPSEQQFGDGDNVVIKLVLTADQKNIIEVVRDVMRGKTGNSKLTESEAVVAALEEWLPKPKYVQEMNAQSAEDSFGSYTGEESNAPDPAEDETSPTPPSTKKPTVNKTSPRSGGTRR